MRRSTVLTALVLASMIALVPASAAAPYDLGTSNDVHVPEQTVTIDGTDYDIDAVGQVQQGEQLQVSVDVDGDREYSLDLYNRDEQVVEWEEDTGDGTATFNTSALDPGTYALALGIDGSFEVIQPVVVSDYDLSVDAPAEATAGEPFDVTVDVGEQVTASETVTVGIYRDGTEITKTAPHTGDGTYVATVDPGTTGDWTVYGAVRADGQAAGYQTSTGIASGQSVTIATADDGDSGTDDGTGETPGGSDGENGTDDGTSPDDGNDTDSGNHSEVDDGSTDPGTDPDDNSSESDGTTDGTSDDGSAGDDDGSEGDDDSDGPTEPNEPGADDSDDNATDDSTEQDDTLAPSLLVPIVAVLVGTGVALRRFH